MTLRARVAPAVTALALALALALAATLLPPTVQAGAHAATLDPEGVDAAARSAERRADHEADHEVDHVLIISVDGLNPAALNRLGRRGAPHLHRLRREGASTHNARTSVESTSTLPNHTGMVTGRRVRASAGGHGVTWNDQRMTPRTIHRSAGERVESVFTVVAEAGGRTAVFASKPKFTLFSRTWGSALGRSVVQQDNQRLVRVLARDLRTQDRMLRFLHLSWPDSAGHRHRYMSKPYLRAVAQVDDALGTLLATIDADPGLRERTVVLLTSDHGGARSKDHSNPRDPANYRVPFYAYGASVPAGTDLYELNPAYADPGRRRPNYAAANQPIRNIAVGNLALDLLGLPAVPDSTVNRDQDLQVAPAP